MMYKIYPLQWLLERDGGKCFKKNNDFGQKKNYMSSAKLVWDYSLSMWVREKQVNIHA